MRAACPRGGSSSRESKILGNPIFDANFNGEEKYTQICDRLLKTHEWQWYARAWNIGPIIRNTKFPFWPTDREVDAYISVQYFAWNFTLNVGRKLIFPSLNPKNALFSCICLVNWSNFRRSPNAPRSHIFTLKLTEKTLWSSSKGIFQCQSDAKLTLMIECNVLNCYWMRI